MNLKLNNLSVLDNPNEDAVAREKRLSDRHIEVLTAQLEDDLDEEEWDADVGAFVKVKICASE